jgi:hypothetical protein
MQETITWTPVTERLPDDDTSVLLQLSDGEVTTGWHEGRRWMDVTGYPVFDVSHWAPMPVGVQAQEAAR